MDNVLVRSVPSFRKIQTPNAGDVYVETLRADLPDSDVLNSAIAWINYYYGFTCFFNYYLQQTNFPQCNLSNQRIIFAFGKFFYRHNLAGIAIPAFVHHPIATLAQFADFFVSLHDAGMRSRPGNVSPPKPKNHV